MKKFLALVFSFFCLIGSFTLADLAGYTITNYDVEMNLHQDGSMDVNETIDVNFSESRRGIYRKIPFYNPSGRYTIIENLKAEGDPATSYTENNTYQLRIGDANRSIIGPHTYHISYTVKNAIAGFEENDSNWTELYWNVIGTERETNIDKVHFTLHLPKETAFSSDEYYTVYGKQGEKKTEGSQISAINTTTLEGNITKRLSANQGVTIGVKFPADYFNLTESYESNPTKANENIQAPVKSSSYDGWIYTFVIIIIIIGNIIATPKSVQYVKKHPILKKILNILLIGIIISISCFFDNYGLMIILSALMIGIIFISNNKGHGRKSHISKQPITIYYTPPKGINIILASKLYEIDDEKIFSALIYYWTTKGYLSIEGKQEKFLRATTTRYMLHRKKTISGIHELLIGKIFLAKNTLVLSDISYSIFERYKNTLSIETKILLQPYYTKVQKKILGIFPITVETLNEQGKYIYEQIRGFAYFLEHVEEPRLQQMLKDNPDYIDEVLPRAVLFGVETNFLQAIEQVIQKPYQPEWYTGDTLFSTIVLHNLSSQIQSATTPPSSSGFSVSGGGGSSGGGGGGGGGGSR